MKMICHDPRRCNDRDCKLETENPALIVAELHRMMFTIEVDWDNVADWANYCDGKPTDLAALPDRIFKL